jgi:2-polyprenyl-3-methyl-5-hydroxy-6-metoxy-1,4-benzoquinol methylase
MSSTDVVAPSLTTEGGRACPVCEHRVAPRIELPDYILFECSQCGCWSSDALVRGATLSFEPSRYFAHAATDEVKWEALLRRLGPRNVQAALDVGCGTGAFLTWAARRFPDAERIGIEIEPARAEQARRESMGAKVHTGDALTTLDSIDRPVDLITLWDVFEHVTAPARLLERLAKSLSRGGAIYIQTIHEHSLAPRIGRMSYLMTAGRVTGMVRRTHEPHHLVFFSRAGLERMADRAGLRVSQLWFDHLARARMDGSRVVTAATSMMLSLENVLGNGLFVNLILEPKR